LYKIVEQFNPVTMKETILTKLNQPEELEKLYRQNKSGFTRDFMLLYPEINDHIVARVWKERLSSMSDELSWGRKGELTLILLFALLAFGIAKMPLLFGLDEEQFYTRNVSFIVFPFLAAYFVWKLELKSWRLLAAAAGMLISVLYINLLPFNAKSDSLVLVNLHMPILVWSIVGFIFVGDSRLILEKRLGFLRFNGDLIVMGTVICIAGFIMSIVTIGLFELISLKIGEFYFRNFGLLGLTAAPIVATYLVQVNPQLVGKVSPVVARIFTPLVLVMLVSYLIAVVYTGQNPYTNREFLLIFNLLLVGVMAIILFSVADGLHRQSKNKTEIALLLALSVVTILVNGVALSAILFRINEWGITPNRLSVLGSNILILINLVQVAVELAKALRTSGNTEPVGRAIAWYLPVYTIWAAIVVFLFPIIFNYQ